MNPKRLVQVAPTPMALGRNCTQPPLKCQGTGAQTQSKAGTASWRSRTVKLGRNLSTTYSSLQVSHRGMYSIEKLKAFQTYCDKTSVVRAVSVCFLTPIPSLLVVILLECIPLRAPEEGWKVNSGFWIRFFLSGMVIAVSSTFQIADVVDRLRISIMQCLCIGAVVMSVYVATLVTVASMWVFPVPFGVVFGIGPVFAVYTIVLVLTIGRSIFMATPGLNQEIKLQCYALGAQGVIAFIYPAFSSVYLKASSTQRAGLVLLLPLTKTIMKNTVARACSHLEDYVPVIAVFSIEVSNALYVATCMQSTQSTSATIVIITFDIVNGALILRSLINRTQAIHKQRQLLEDNSAGKYHPAEELLPSVMHASQHFRIFRTHRGTAIRVRAPLKLRLGTETDRVLGSLVGRLLSFEKREAKKSTSETAIPSFTDVNSSTPPKLPKPSSDCAASVGPHTLTHSMQSSKQAFRHEEQKLELVESTLQLLFSCEYHALVEYVECAVPMIFGIYSSILCQLPSRKYYPLTRDMAPGQLEGMLTSLSVYVALEVASFVVMHMILKRKFKLSALYQLAFVLETQVVQIQSRLFFWIVFILQFTLQHYGVDFTFKFEWMH